MLWLQPVCLYELAWVSQDWDKMSDLKVLFKSDLLWRVKSTCTLFPESPVSWETRCSASLQAASLWWLNNDQTTDLKMMESSQQGLKRKDRKKEKIQGRETCSSPSSRWPDWRPSSPCLPPAPSPPCPRLTWSIIMMIIYIMMKFLSVRVSRKIITFSMESHVTTSNQWLLTTRNHPVQLQVSFHGFS